MAEQIDSPPPTAMRDLSGAPTSRHKIDAAWVLTLTLAGSIAAPMVDLADVIDGIVDAHAGTWQQRS